MIIENDFTNHITFIFFGAKENETKETKVVDEINNFIEKHSFSKCISSKLKPLIFPKILPRLQDLLTEKFTILRKRENAIIKNYNT